MVLRHRHNVFCARLFKKRSPCVRIKLFRLKHRNEIFVAEILVCTVGFDMVLVDLGALYVHVTRIPFAVKRRHAVHAPVDENAELRLLIPLRRLPA